MTDKHNKWDAARSKARRWAMHIRLSDDCADQGASLLDEAIEFLEAEDVIGFAAITTVACAVLMASNLHFEHIEHIIRVHDTRAKSTLKKTNYRNEDTRGFLMYCATLVGLLEDDVDGRPLTLEDSIKISRAAMFSSINGDQKVIDSARELHGVLAAVIEIMPDELRETSQQAVELITKTYGDVLKKYLPIEKYCTLFDILEKSDDDPVFGMCISIASYRVAVSQGYIPAYAQRKINEFSNNMRLPDLAGITGVKGKANIADISKMYPGNSMNN